VVSAVDNSTGSPQVIVDGNAIPVDSVIGITAAPTTAQTDQKAA
jgi:hypothetical protein